MLNALPLGSLWEVLQRSQQCLPLGPSPALWIAEGQDASKELIRPRTWDLLDANFASMSSSTSALWLPVLEEVFGYRRHLGLVDGLGRCLLLLTELFNSLLVPLKELRTDKKALSMASNCQQSVLEQQRVLRLLMQHRGILLYDKTPAEENGKPMGVDWLDQITHDTVVELARRGDFFFLDPCTAALQGAPHSALRDLKPTSLYALVAGSAYHLLATEVEGDVRDTLHRVLMEFLFQDKERNALAQAYNESNGLSPSSENEQHRQLERLKQRLEAFYSTRQIMNCFSNPLPSCTSFSAAARDEMPTFVAPVSCSQLLPRTLIILPVIGSEASSWSGRSFTITSKPCLSSSLPLESIPFDQVASSVRVLVLRLDPAGEWLPEAEDLYNTQTFFSYYSNDISDVNEGDRFCLMRRRSRGSGALRGAQRRKGVDSDESEEEESFYEMQARQTGTSNCLRPDHVGWRRRESNPVRAPVTDSCHYVGQSEEEAFFEGLVDRACTQLLPPSQGRQQDDRASGVSFLEFRAAIRLFLWCLLHGVSVVLTPERVPPLFKRFGERHGRALQLHLKQTEAIWSEKGRCSPAGETAGESVVRIVDELRLECFERLLSVFPCLHEPSDHPERFVARSAAVLSRDRLRLPSVVEDALFSVSECALTTVEAMLQRKQVQEQASASMPNSVGYIPTPRQLVCVLRVVEPPVSGERRWVPPPLLAGSILIAAPTRGLERRWIRLLQKCIATLRGIFHEPSHPSQCLSLQALGHLASEAGVVRAGGAFFFAFHRCLRRQISALRSGHCGSSFSGLQGLIHVLDKLALACFAMPQQLAKHIVTDTILDPATGGVGLPQGPRARERLWRLATQHAAGLEMPLEDHELHVFLKSFREKADMLLYSRQTRQSKDGSVRGGNETSHYEKTHTSDPSGHVSSVRSSYSQALHLFASDLASSPRSESMYGGKTNGDQLQPPRWMFVEAIEPNREAVRLALVACYLIVITL